VENGIYLLENQANASHETIDGLPFPTVAETAPSEKPSEIEREVMVLFEQLRNPLLRYALSFGIPVHDAEEVVQEVFLCFFRHLQLRRSRKNLRGWVFRVAHNLALKQRYANQRSRNNATSDWTIAEGQFDPSPDPEAQLSSAQRRSRLMAGVRALPEADQSCPPAACRGSPLPGNSGGTRHVFGSGIDIADTVASTVDPCGREIGLC